jgi:hypothetical protein
MRSIRTPAGDVSVAMCVLPKIVLTTPWSTGAARIAPEELHAEALFEGFHLVAHRGARDAEFGRRQAEAAEPSRRLEGSQGTQGGQVASGQDSSPLKQIHVVTLPNSWS